MKTPERLKDKNIIVRDLSKLAWGTLAITLLIANFVAYPVICLFFDSSAVRKEISEILEFLFESDL